MSIKPYNFTPDQLQMHAAWVKAAREGRLEIPCKTVSDARRLRFSLYNAVKPYRSGRVPEDKVSEAMEQVTVHLVETPKPMVLMQHKMATPMMQSLLAVLEGEEVAQAPVMTREEVESLQRLQELMQEPVRDTEGLPSRANPYFTRERG